MKILFCATVSIHLKSFHLPLIRDLGKRGNIVDSVSNGDLLDDSIRNHFNVCFSRNPFDIKNIKAYFQIKKILKENNYDIISTHTPIASLLIRVAARKNKEIKVIYMAHGFHFYQGSSKMNYFIYRSLEKICAKFTDVLITINKEDYVAAQKFTLKPKGKLCMIPGVGYTPKYKPTSFNIDQKRLELGLDRNDVVLLSVGELNANKNHIFAIKCLEKEFKRNPNLKYYICGEGNLRGIYSEYIEKNNLEKNVFLLGYRTDIIDILKVVNVFIFPSIREGLPVSIIEAMSEGVVVLASKIRGNVDLIQEGRNGFLFEVNNEKSFLSKFSKIKENNYVNKEISCNNKDDAQKYSYSSLLNTFLDLYEIE